MKIQSVNPATGELIMEFEPAGIDEVTATVARARTAQVKWAELMLETRAEYFHRFAETLQNNTQKILKIMKEETGKLFPDGEAEVYDVIDAIDYYLDKMRALHLEDSVQLSGASFPDTKLIIEYVPYGVTGLIMPWNFAFYSPMMFIIASLVAGNSVVLKPSEHSTLVGLLIKDLFLEAGFPEGVVEVVVGAGDTGRLLVRSSIDKIFFVGSVKAGKDIMANAAVKPVQVELGGNSAAIVLGDADLELASQGIAWAGTYHSGQDCVGIKRVFVVQSVAEEFVERLTNIAKTLRPGIDYGPFITPDAMDRVKARIDDAVNRGAKLLCGGELIHHLPGRGNWLTPAVMIYDDPNLELVAEETFGNVLPVMIVSSGDEAVRQANNSIYGLSNAIFTGNISTAHELASRLQSGMVFINDPFIAMPGWDHWTGWKNSGFGTAESKLVQCLKKKVVSVNQQLQKREFWYPYAESQIED